MQPLPNLSFWEQEIFFKKADVLIIGSGIVGLNAALHLKELDPALDVAVLERGPLPLGASTRNAGFACFGSPTELLDDLAHRPEEEVWQLVEERWLGLQLLRERVGDDYLQYESFGGYEIFQPQEETVFQQCLNRLDDFNKQFQAITGEANSHEVRDKYISRFGFKGVAHLIRNRLEGQIHPGKMVQRLQQLALDQGVKLLYGLDIQDIQEDEKEVVVKIAGANWNFKARKILVATNGFAQRLLPKLAVRAARNQVLITKPLAQVPFQGCFHYDRGYFYFRNVGNRILLGGGRNLALEEEQTDSFGNTVFIQNALLELLQEILLPTQPIEVEQWWSGILGLGDQKKPIVQHTSERVVVAVRLGGMGVAIGSRVGTQAAELLVKG